MKAVEVLKVMITEKEESLKSKRIELDSAQGSNNVQDQLNLSRDIGSLILEINRLEGLLWALTGEK